MTEDHEQRWQELLAGGPEAIQDFMSRLTFIKQTPEEERFWRELPPDLPEEQFMALLDEKFGFLWEGPPELEAAERRAGSTRAQLEDEDLLP